MKLRDLESELSNVDPFENPKSTEIDLVYIVISLVYSSVNPATGSSFGADPHISTYSRTDAIHSCQHI